MTEAAMSVLDLAASHQTSQQDLARRTAERAARLWRRVDRNSIAGSWRILLPDLYRIVVAAQIAAAGQADDYLGALARQFDLGEMAGSVNPAGFGGHASDGRDLLTLMYQPAVTALSTIKGGAAPARAMASGLFALDMITRTQIADAGRMADSAAMVARPQITGYVRMLSGGSCSRCVILAGRWYRWNAGFNRHPRCDCTAIPARENLAGDLRTDPDKYFRSLSREEQDRAFGPAAAEAIRDGADMNRVVNSARGMYTAGGKKYTNELASRRPRITVEQIYIEAAGNRPEAIRLLKLHRYLL